MPSKKRKDGSYRDIAHPLNQETRTELEEKVLKAYLAEIKGGGQDGGPSDGTDVDSGDGGDTGSDGGEPSQQTG